MKYTAYLFDLNGTMVDDMDYHIRAWHRILNELGGNISLERAKKECYGKNHELLERVFPNRFSLEEKERIGLEKELQYQREFKPQLKLLPGLQEFLQQSKAAGIRMAIGSAAIMSNINFVIDGLDIRHYFDSIISADEVKESKPRPETFLRCAGDMNVPPVNCLVFEDAPKGVESAQNAGMDCLVLTTLHEAPEFGKYRNIIGFAPDYTSLRVDQINLESSSI